MANNVSTHATDANLKDLNWESHRLELEERANVSAACFGINPNGPAPTLVDAGALQIQSKDAHGHLDETYPALSLRAASNPGMTAWLQLAAEERAKCAICQSSQKPKALHAKQAGRNTSATGVLDRAKSVLGACLSKLTQALTDRRWVKGDRCRLADISWIPLHLALKGCGYPVDLFQTISVWADAFAQTDSFQEGVLSWCPDCANA